MSPVSGQQMTSAASRWSSQGSEGLQKIVFSTDIKGRLCYWGHKEMEEGSLTMWKDKISFPSKVLILSSGALLF